MQQRVMSAMRPTGKLHLGHYLGVIDNWVKLQDDYDCFYQVADWHALTTKYDKTETLKKDVLDVLIDWLASGVDPEKSTLYVQSLVPQTAELHVYLSMITPQNWIERDPTLKDTAKMLKLNTNKPSSQVNYGLLGYPVLMAADILLFNADFVPVGIDQTAHVELTRDIARRFNYIYNTEFFVEPQPKLNECPLLCGLDGNKMGKSFNNDIKIADNDEITAKKIMSAITDRNKIRKDDPGHPDECEVIYKYWKIFGSNPELEKTKSECETALRGCIQCKRALIEKINERFAKIRERRIYFESHMDEVEKIVKEGSKKAQKEADKTIKRVRDIIGMYSWEMK